jgi:hypothetical protein
LISLVRTGYGEGDDYDSENSDGGGGPGQFDGYDSEEDEYNLKPLGLLNGQYEVTSDSVTNEWPRYGSDFNLVLTLDGNQLWGRFELGLIEWVM